MPNWTLYEGDCLEVMRSLPENSVDAVVTDPPYGLSREPDIEEVLSHWLAGDDYKHRGGGFMGKTWDSFVPGPTIWKEVYRVLKPGGHILCFAGTRTVDLMGISLRMAGFEIRDTLQWLYGCLSEDTECLTQEGWKKYTELTTADKVMQWDHATGALTWVHPRDVVVFPFEGELVRLANRHTDQLLTPNHRVYAKVRRHSRDEAPTGYEVVEAGEIKKHWIKDLPLAGLYAGSKQVDTAYAYLVGWWLTDAWPHGDGKACMFSQSKPDTLEKLRDALAAADCEVSEYVKGAKKGTHNDEYTFYVRGPLADKLLTEFPTREMGLELLEWDTEARKALLEGLIDGDGSRREGQYGYVFWSRDQKRLDVVQLLGMSLGYRTLMDSKKGCVHINPAKDSTQLQHRHIHERVPYTGNVWCVRVPTGAFVVRRNGNVFITGNSGFPKSMDISKAIDKKLGAERKIVGLKPYTNDGSIRGNSYNKGGYERVQLPITAPATPEAKQWEGWGTALKPANEPIILARKPLSEATVAENVLRWGTGGLNIDGSRIGTDTITSRPSNMSNNNHYAQDKWTKSNPIGELKTYTGRFPANVLLDEEAAALLDEQSGIRQGGARPARRGPGTKVYHGWPNGTNDGVRIEYESGGASRFFYVAKASRSERTMGGKVENNHPTVKPLKLMRYLCRLITPPGGTVLDPFAGSGTTLLAATQEGFSCIGIEKEAEYCEIIRQRMQEAVQVALPMDA